MLASAFRPLSAHLGDGKVEVICHAGPTNDILEDVHKDVRDVYRDVNRLPPLGPGSFWEEARGPVLER